MEAWRGPEASALQNLAFLIHKGGGGRKDFVAAKKKAFEKIGRAKKKRFTCLDLGEYPAKTRETRTEGSL